MYYGFDPLYFILIGPALLLAVWAQFQVKSAFARWSKSGCSSGLTGAQAAYEMLRSYGLENTVKVEQTKGFLSDHYDPSHRVLRLSPNVYNSTSLAAVGVACHEAGHALQHAKEYGPLVIRNLIVPVASIGSYVAWPMMIFGMMLNFYDLALMGFIAFGALVVFQVINLPVEFNASGRAKEFLAASGIIRGRQEEGAVAAVLNAAALTYVAATAQAILQMLYFAIRLGLLNGRDD